MIRIRIMPPGDHRNHGNINCSWPISSSFRPAASQNKFKELTNFTNSGASVLQKPPHGHWLPIQVSGVSERWAMKKKQWKSNSDRAMKMKLTTPGTRAVGWWLDQVKAKVAPPPTLVAGRHRYYCCAFDHAKQDQQHHQQMQLCSLLESGNPTLGGLLKKRWFLVAWVQMLPPPEKVWSIFPRKIFIFVFCWELNPTCMNWILQKSCC